jgi:hypothetical protein
MLFWLDTNLNFYFDSFRSTLIHMFNLLTSGPLNMAFDHLWNLFDLKDLGSGFP